MRHQTATLSTPARGIRALFTVLRTHKTVDVMLRVRQTSMLLSGTSFMRESCNLATTMPSNALHSGRYSLDRMCCARPVPYDKNCALQYLCNVLGCELTRRCISFTVLLHIASSHAQVPTLGSGQPI